jgi:hypothetical protein
MSIESMYISRSTPEEYRGRKLPKGQFSEWLSAFLDTEQLPRWIMLQWFDAIGDTEIIDDFLYRNSWVIMDKIKSRRDYNMVRNARSSVAVNLRWHRREIAKVRYYQRFEGESFMVTVMCFAGAPLEKVLELQRLGIDKVFSLFVRKIPIDDIAGILENDIDLSLIGSLREG